MRSLCLLLLEPMGAAAVEADLSRYHHVDLRELWQPGTELTLRRVAALIRYLPPSDSAVALYQGKERPFNVAELLLMQLWSVWSGKEHPAMPKKDAGKSTRDPSRVARARARKRQRDEAIARGGVG
jgi:hypothetical protein